MASNALYPWLTPRAHLEQNATAPAAMGLASGEHGVKATVKRIFEDAIAEIVRLQDIRETLKKKSKQCCVVVDGNVMLRSAPDAVVELDAYVEFCRRQLDRAFDAGDHVVLVFDEPENITKAKAEEQKQRDTQRLKHSSHTVITSTDIPRLPTTDHFLISSLPTDFSARDLILVRSARSRVFDEVAHRLFRHYKKSFAGVLPGAEGRRSFTVDGLDDRGGDRPVGDRRKSCLISTLPDAERIFARASPVGEGDLKMTVVVDELWDEAQSNADSPLADVELFLLNTIDTDSIVIELSSYIRRLCTRAKTPEVMLCLRERPKRARDGDEAIGFYTVFDMEELFKHIMSYLFKEQTHVPLVIQRKACALFSLGAILSGTDYTKLPGVRFSDILEIVSDICTNNIEALAGMHGAWSSDDAQLIRVGTTVKQLLDALAKRLEGVARRWKHSASLREPDFSQVSKALWTLSYWHMPLHERKNTTYWGFPAVLVAPAAAEPAFKPRSILEAIEAPLESYASDLL